MNIVLIGFSHCGKSTVGKLLAEELAKPFFDTDQMMIDGTDCKTARELYQQIGKAAFRALEISCIRKLAYQDNVVIATGGGAILISANSNLLKQNGQLIYLENQPALLWERIIARGIPAYLQDSENPYQAFLNMYAERERVYKGIADQCVSTVSKTPTEIMKLLLQHIVLQ